MMMVLGSPTKIVDWPALNAERSPSVLASVIHYRSSRSQQTATSIHRNKRTRLCCTIRYYSCTPITCAVDQLIGVIHSCWLLVRTTHRLSDVFPMKSICNSKLFVTSIIVFSHSFPPSRKPLGRLVHPFPASANKTDLERHGAFIRSTWPSHHQRLSVAITKTGCALTGHSQMLAGQRRGSHLTCTMCRIQRRWSETAVSRHHAS